VLTPAVKDINVGLPLLSLTVTVYMVAQALAPSFWGPLSDARGRRITFIGEQGAGLRIPTQSIDNGQGLLSYISVRV
jgi:MFS family permease